MNVKSLVRTAKRLKTSKYLMFPFLLVLLLLAYNQWQQQPDLEWEEAEEDVDAMRDEAGSEIVPSARESQHSAASMPVITSEQYNQYVRSLIKLMVGETTTFEWVKRGAYRILS